MDKKFEEWLWEFNSNREDLKKGDILGKVQEYNQNEKDLLNWYMKYKAENLEDKSFQNWIMKEQTNLLWYQQRYNYLLALATIILAFTSILHILKIYNVDLGKLFWIFIVVIAVCVELIILLLLELFGLFKKR